jgi:hypothetical protein
VQNPCQRGIKGATDEAVAGRWEISAIGIELSLRFIAVEKFVEDAVYELGRVGAAEALG